MRKFFLGFIIISLFGCKEKNRNFYGIGEFKLDTEFKNLSSAKLFRSISKNVSKADSLKISEEVGFVKNLIVKTDNGKIYAVEFDCSDSTNIFAIDSLMKDFEKYNSINNNTENNSTPIQINQLSDGNVILQKSRQKSSNQISYSYSDIKKVLKYAN